MIPPKMDTDVRAVVEALAKQKRKYKDNPQYVVWFEAPYAIYQHEELSYHHEYGEAKFLEKTVRNNGHIVRRIIREALERGRTLRQAVRLGTEALLRMTRPRTPMKTGYLRESGQVLRIEDAPEAPTSEGD